MDPVTIISVFGALSGCLLLGWRVGRKGGYAEGYAVGYAAGRDSVRPKPPINVRRTRPQPRKESEEPAWMD